MKKSERAVILLKDLAPLKEIKGGANKRVFGERIEGNEQSKPATSKDANRRRSPKD